jgi:hypothetical protein
VGYRALPFHYRDYNDSMIVRFMQDTDDVCSYIQRIMCDRGIPSIIPRTHYKGDRGKKAPKASTFPRMLLVKWIAMLSPFILVQMWGLLRDSAQWLVSISVPYI